MADLSITASLVASVSGAQIDRTSNAGATITAGQLVYRDSAGLWQLSDANSAAAAKTITGVALHGSLNGQPLAVQLGGDITIGATVGVGTVYVLSGTPGGIALGCPGTTDLATGMTTCIFGIGISTTVIRMGIFNSGVAVP